MPWLRAFRALCDAPAERARLGEAGRRYVIDHHDREESARSCARAAPPSGRPAGLRPGRRAPRRHPGHSPPRGGRRPGSRGAWSEGPPRTGDGRKGAPPRRAPPRTTRHGVAPQDPDQVDVGRAVAGHRRAGEAVLGAAPGDGHGTMRIRSYSAGKGLDEFLQLPTRPHQAHVALDDVVDLGQLVEPACCQRAAERRVPLVAPGIQRRTVGAVAHRPELEHLEGPAAPPDGHGAIQDRAGPVDENRDREHERDQGRERQSSPSPASGA